MKQETIRQIQDHFQAEVQYLPAPAAGGFEIIAITAGEGNGWQFGADCLRDSVGLWEGANTFIDHSQPWEGHSIRDLAGVCCGASFDEDCQGIRLQLKPGGPSGALLTAVGSEWLESSEPKPKIGFSADLIFNAVGKEVRQILRVVSLDLVIHPARGGSFLRAIQSVNDLFNQQEEKIMPALLMKADEPSSNQGSASPAKTGLGVYASLLDSRLARERLPETLTRRIRSQFAGKEFQAVELEEAVLSARQLMADLQGGQAVSGIGRVSEMRTSGERLQAAVDDLFGVPRETALKNTAVARLSGIRELYLMLTGDVDLHGRLDASRVSLADTTSLPNLVKNAMNKVIVQTWEELGRSGFRWWEPLVKVEHFNNLQEVTGLLVGEVGGLASVAEGADYGELTINDSGESGAWTKYGGILPLTLEMIDRDETYKLRQMPRKLTHAAVRNISSLVASVFTSAAGSGPLMSDGAHVFDANEHSNLGTVALSATSWEAASESMYNQSQLAGSGVVKLAADAKYLLVPRALRLTAMRILYPSFEREANLFSDNLQRGEQGDVITVPEFSDANDWAAVADPRIAPAIMIAERFGLMPEIFVASSEYDNGLFTADKVNLKVRHFLSVFVADYRPLFKANVV